MITPLVSPTEPAELRAAIEAIVSSLPETCGVDFLFHFYHSEGIAMCGIQRKVFPADFLASVEDGRLTKELMQMRETQLALRIILFEGRPKYTDGRLMRGRFPSRYTREAIDNMLLSIQARYGVIFETTEDKWSTVQRLLQIQKYLGELGRESSFATRHKNDGRVQDWYTKPPEEERIAWFYQGVPCVGPEIAKLLVRTFPHPIDLLLADKDKLKSIPGIGPVTASKIMSFLRQEQQR